MYNFHKFVSFFLFFVFVEKTKNLLFTGARKQLEDVVMDANENSAFVPNQNMNRQMCLDKTGHLVTPKVTPEEPSVPVFINEMDIDAIQADTTSNKKISDFFTVKCE